MNVFGSESSQDRLEVIAQAIHKDYVESQTRKGETTETNPALVGWEALPEHIKESNRSQAVHIAEKLKAVGCIITESECRVGRRFEFEPDEMEQLAWMEHDRWVKERLADSWTVGPKSIDKKTHPLLLMSYDELPEAEKEKDREAVRRIPELLAKVGLEVRRS